MAKKASENFKRYQNPNGPDITTVSRPIIEADGLYFKDIDGSGTVSKVNDWRLPSAERAAAYVKQMTVATSPPFTWPLIILAASWRVVGSLQCSLTACCTTYLLPWNRMPPNVVA